MDFSRLDGWLAKQARKLPVVLAAYLLLAHVGLWIVLRLALWLRLPLLELPMWAWRVWVWGLWLVMGGF